MPNTPQTAFLEEKEHWHEVVASPWHWCYSPTRAPKDVRFVVSAAGLSSSIRSLPPWLSLEKSSPEIKEEAAHGYSKSNGPWRI